MGLFINLAEKMRVFGSVRHNQRFAGPVNMTSDALVGRKSYFLHLFAGFIVIIHGFTEIKFLFLLIQQNDRCPFHAHQILNFLRNELKPLI